MLLAGGVHYPHSVGHRERRSKRGSATGWAGGGPPARRCYSQGATTSPQETAVTLTSLTMRESAAGGPVNTAP